MRQLIIISLLGLGLCACERTRADYRDEIAGAVCQKMQGCGKIGEGGKFANMDDCKTEIASRYNKMWSAKKCEQRIDPEKFGQCKMRALTNACEGNVLDAVSFKLECGADDVCTVEPPVAK